MKCDGCFNALDEDIALYTTYDIDCVYMQFTFCDENCREAFESNESLTQEEIDTRNDAIWQENFIL